MGNQGFQVEAANPRFSLRAEKGIKLLSISLRNQTSERQRERASKANQDGIPVSHPA